MKRKRSLTNPFIADNPTAANDAFKQVKSASSIFAYDVGGGVVDHKRRIVATQFLDDGYKSVALTDKERIEI